MVLNVEVGLNFGNNITTKTAVVDNLDENLSVEYRYYKKDLFLCVSSNGNCSLLGSNSKSYNGKDLCTNYNDSQSLINPYFMGYDGTFFYKIDNKHSNISSFESSFCPTLRDKFLSSGLNYSLVVVEPQNAFHIFNLYWIFFGFWIIFLTSSFVWILFDFFKRIQCYEFK